MAKRRGGGYYLGAPPFPEILDGRGVTGLTCGGRDRRRRVAAADRREDQAEEREPDQALHEDWARVRGREHGRRGRRHVRYRVRFASSPSLILIPLSSWIPVDVSSCPFAPYSTPPHTPDPTSSTS